jgi:hypothetical protein
MWGYSRGGYSRGGYSRGGTPITCMGCARASAHVWVLRSLTWGAPSAHVAFSRMRCSYIERPLLIGGCASGSAEQLAKQISTTKIEMAPNAAAAACDTRCELLRRDLC